LLRDNRIMSQFTVHGNMRAPASRIISLAPSITELLYYLGLGESVVGVTRQCDYPEAVKGVASIGSFLMPESKSLVELSPDIVVGLSDLHRHVPEAVDSGKSGVILLNYHSVLGVLGAMEALASLAGDTENTLGLVDSLRRRVVALQTRSKNRRGIKTLFMMHDDPVYTPGRDSFQYDALKIAGAVQMPYNNAQYERINLEQVVHFNPEVLIACGRHRGEKPRKICPDCQVEQPICQRVVDDIAEKPGWRETKAAATGRVVALPCHWICRPGPRLIDGMEQIEKIFLSMR